MPDGRPGSAERRVPLGEQMRHPLMRNGYALVLNSGATAVLGMVFWVLAARRFSVEEVGVGSALVAAMALLSTIAQLNLANVLARFLPTAGHQSGRLILACSVATATAAVVVGTVFVAGSRWWSPSLPVGAQDVLLDVWFVTALVLWCLFVVQDGALSGLRRSDWVLAKNTAHGVLKAAALVVPAIAVSSSAVFLAWTVSVIPVLAIIGLVATRRFVPEHVARTERRAQPVAPGDVVRFASLDYLVALAGTGLTSALPLIVLESSGAPAAAYFTMAWSVSYALYLVGRSMATSLLVEGAGDRVRLDEYSWRATVHIVAILVPLVTGTVLLAPLLMRLFGAAYATDGTTVLRLLAVAALPSAVIVVYSAVERVRGRMLRLVLVTVTTNATALGLAWVLLETHGLPGVGLAWLATQTVAALVLLCTTLGPLWLPRLDGRAARRFLRLASSARAAARRRRHQRLLQRRFPDLAASFGLPSSWRIGRVFTTVGDVAVAEVGGPDAPAVLKLALTDRGSEALLGSSRAVDALRSDPRLDGWTALLPQPLGRIRAADDRVVVLERRVRGTDGRDVLGSGPAERAVDAVLDEIAVLHRRTGRLVTVDATLQRAWVDEPVAVLADWLADTPPASVTDLRERLREGLRGRTVMLGWTHGDLAPGNVLFTDDERPSGIIDWEHARPDGLSGVDTAHFLLTVRMVREGRELGDLVCELLRHPPGEGGVLGDPTLVLLAWLHHVAGTVTKTEGSSPDSVWAARNVHPVLHQLRSST